MLSRIVRSMTLDLLQRAGIRPGMACLDLGCGGGDVAVELARLVAPEGRVVGIDVDEAQVEIARAEINAQQLHSIELKVANLEEHELPMGFDLVHLRFVLQHLRNPRKLLEKVHAALRPGGIVVIADTNFAGLFSYPDSATAQRYVEIITETEKRRGGDANIGLRVPQLLSDAGFENVQIKVYQHAGMSGEEKLINPMTLEFIADVAIAEGVAPRDDIDKIAVELYSFARDPNTLLSGPRIIGVWAHRPD